MSFILNGAAVVGRPYAPLQIKTGKLDVVVAGTVITADNRSVEFLLANLQIVFSFQTDGSSPRLGDPSTSGETLTIPLYNFNNSIGAGTTQPIEIGKLSNRKLLVSFMIYALSAESSKTIHYTFYVGEPA